MESQNGNVKMKWLIGALCGVLGVSCSVTGLFAYDRLVRDESQLENLRGRVRLLENAQIETATLLKEIRQLILQKAG